MFIFRISFRYIAQTPLPMQALNSILTTYPTGALTVITKSNGSQIFVGLFVRQSGTMFEPNKSDFP